eukprot:TRINITY_DN42267_c0_g1_i1.p1 TRINITY_DN42267_c0_g1~~TRINITY_DN42267_c0_g1_i1.p1  ORF type:complete len:274 (+),score=36.63 TRINITY_DN42267_c0_g1_i1:77-898(+)
MPPARSASEYAVRLMRSLRDATKHRRLRPPVGGERFPVPAGLEPLESAVGQRLASEARLEPKLLGALQRQEHPAFCAIASAMTLARSQGAGPTDQKNFMEVFKEARAWPPVMATYGLDALDSLPGWLKYHLLSHLQYDGAPMALLAEWFRVLGFQADVVSSGEVDEDELRKDVAAAFPSDGSARTRCLLVNYSRTVIGQRMFSGGHYAPVGGFHEPSDKVLLLEVNSWRYPSVWVNLPLLWSAMHTRVGNGTWRGYLRVSSAESTDHASIHAS